MFELQTLPAPAGFEKLGQVVEFHELAYCDVKAAMNAAPTASERLEAVLGATILVDGAPLGLEGVQHLPGHMLGAIGSALEFVADYYGLVPKKPAAGEAANEAPATQRDEGPRMGEA